ncbi:MAG: CGNR zinc finger domain-containing protein [Bryobacteraceae bacterium]
MSAHAAKLARAPARFLLLGGRLAIDFVNSSISVGGKTETLQTWPDLVNFLAVTGAVNPERAGLLRDLEHSAPQESAALLMRTLELREALRKILQARVERSPIPEQWVAPINAVLQCTEGYDHLVPAAGGESRGTDWRLTLEARSSGLDWLLAAIARSAAELLTEGSDAKIRKCANPDCALFFCDDSRTGARRWCRMAVCGNRAKAVAHSRRKRSTGI